MTARADALRAARLLFQRAIAGGVTLQEARRRDAAERWGAADRRLAARRTPSSAVEPVQLAWWQQ